MKSKLIAIIPARGGSKRVNRKNISLINNKPLLWYSTNCALESMLFDNIYVNSEDDEILNVAKECDVDTYKRPETLATDSASVIDVIHDMVNTLGLQDDDVLFILLPTAPLRKSEDLKEAYELFNQNKQNNSVVSVTTYETPIQLAQYVNENNILEPVFADSYKKSTKSTGHKTAYKFNEVVVINSVKNFKNHTNLIGKAPVAYVMDPEDSYTIDYEYQKRVIELIIKERDSK